MKQYAGLVNDEAFTGSRSTVGIKLPEKAKSMTAGSFPSDPANRRVILVLQQHDTERCSYEPGAAQILLDEEAYVLQFPVRAHGNTHRAIRNILDAGLARPGSVLVQSPYDPETYEDASTAPQRFALAKHMYFSNFCMSLGAKEVSVEQIDIQTRTGRTTLNAKGERLGVDAQLTAESEDLREFRTHLHLRDEFVGGPPNLAAAEHLLRQTRLWSDPNLRTLLEMRGSETNQLMNRTLILSLSSEAKNNINIVGRLKIPTFVKLTAEYDKVVREQHDYTLTVRVRF